MTLTLLIVDDHDEFRRFMVSELGHDGFDVAGEAVDGESALDAADRLRPDVVLLDVQLPGIDGFEVARRLAASAHPPTVVLTSSRMASDYGHSVEDAPIRGFIPKQELSATALSAVLAA